MSSYPSSAAISAACRTLDLKAPPSSKRVLKKKFLELAKKNHPDRAAAANAGQAAVDLATRRMAALTEAYKTLEQCCSENRKKSMMQHQQNHGGADAFAGMNFGSAGDVNFEHERNSPEAKKRREQSMERTWLPWMRMPRDEVPGARPVSADSHGSLRLMMSSFYRAMLPMRFQLFLTRFAHQARIRGWKAMQAAKFIVVGGK